MNSLRSSVRLFACLVSAAALALLSGCLKDRLVWSPDGQQAAVLSSDGLRFCTPDGTLSELTVPEAHLAVWLSDSQRLLIARRRPESSWTAIATLLADAERQETIAAGEKLWAELRDGALWSVATLDLGDRATLPLLYLRDTHGDELRRRLEPSEWDELAARGATVQEVFLARRQGVKVDLGAPLFTVVRDTIDVIRLAPGEKAAALTLARGRDGEHFSLSAITLDGSAAPVAVAAEVAAYPDWTADGRALVYAQAMANHVKDQPQFAVLMQREVFDAAGKPALAETPTELGGLLFQSLGRIRCLADGRIVFNTTELTLPVSARDFEVEREQLFVLDPARQATLARLTPRNSGEQLPRLLAFFEPSADGKMLLIGGTDGEVCVFTLATGEVEQVQKSGKGQLCLPAWRGPGEFTYLRRSTAKPGEPTSRPFEVILRRGDQETVLSTNWPDTILKGVSEN